MYLRFSKSVQSAQSVDSTFRFVVLTAAALLLSGCAAQGPPRPPRIEKPQRVTDLAAAQVGRTIELSFTSPTLATDGEGLSKPLEVELFRDTAQAGQAPSAPSSPLAGPQPWVIVKALDFSRYKQGEKIVYPYIFSQQEFARQLGASFTFTARGVTHGFRHRPIDGDLSNPATATLLDVSAPVEILGIQTTEHAIVLKWSPPTASLSGRPLHDVAGYRIFRSESQTAPFELRGETASASYSDTDFQFEHPYFYKVRALFKSGAQVAESEDSKLLAITPRDTFPPAAPTGLSVISTAVGVEMIWKANTEPDLAGYNVYRSEDGGAPRKLNPESLGTPLFRDTSAQPGHHYRYWVTAIDLARNESAPSQEASLDVQ